MKTTESAYTEGLNAVRVRPHVSPRNPYSDEEEPELHGAWEDGAIDAGITEIYENGILKS